MTRLVKIIDNKYVQIEEYKKSTICFNTNKYSDFEDYCTLREMFDPFIMFYENKQLINQQKEFMIYLKHLSNWYSVDRVKQGIVNEILKNYKDIVGGK